jgi:hypothetical protein
LFVVTDLNKKYALRVSHSQQMALNKNQLKATAENAVTMAAAEATVAVATDLTSVAARMIAVTVGELANLT